MGYYIKNIGTSFKEKVDTLILQHKGFFIEEPTKFIENLVCVVDNGAFAAAAWMNDEEEFKYWIHDDGRKKCWLIVPNASNLAQ